MSYASLPRLFRSAEVLVAQWSASGGSQHRVTCAARARRPRHGARKPDPARGRRRTVASRC